MQLFITVVALWLPFLKAKRLPAASDLKVNGLERVEPAFEHFQGHMYSGLLPMDNGDRHGELMFWLFSPSHPTVADTITVWLNGGPGCSSFFAGVFFETAPVTIPLKAAGTCCVDQQEPFVYNEYSWATATHMLYVEQPVGVGFSHGGPETQDESDVSADFYAFMKNFYQVFTQYQDYQLYIVGESYAGMYVPSIASKIYEENKRSETIQLAGIGIGNGLLDARVQGPIRIDYAYYHGLIDAYTRDILYELWDQCIRHEPMSEPFHSFNVPDDCGMLTAIPLAAGRNSDFPNLPNVYDITTWDPYAVLSGNNSMSLFYNNPVVKEIMHAPPDTFWRGCIPGAGRRRLRDHRNLMASLLINDKPVSTVPYIAELLDGGIRVLMYNGDRDMACNAAGTEQLLNAMKWSGAQEWYSTPRGLWTVGKEPAGYTKSYKNLNFVVVYNSGHLVPYNKPVHSLDLITRFLTNTSFYDYELPNFGQYVEKPKVIYKTKSTAMFPGSSLEASLKQSTMSLDGGSVLPILLAFIVGFGIAYFWQRQSGGYQRI